MCSLVYVASLFNEVLILLWISGTIIFLTEVDLRDKSVSRESLIGNDLGVFSLIIIIFINVFQV